MVREEGRGGKEEWMGFGEGVGVVGVVVVGVWW